jgi:hypothetical protein
MDENPDSRHLQNGGITGGKILVGFDGVIRLEAKAKALGNAGYRRDRDGIETGS